jgi:hypothetical protein
MESAMDVGPKSKSQCAVCGKQSAEHVSWFLVIENFWLDRVKVFFWHPVLAEQSPMHSVCGKQHLELLITHWLTYANLQFDAATMPESALADHGYGPGEGFNLPHPGQLVGELAVHRESVSRLWTGSAEARDSIFQALSVVGEAQPAALETPAGVEFVAAEFVVAPAGRTVRLGEYAV